jgi:WD40 repeat protein
MKSDGLVFPAKTMKRNTPKFLMILGLGTLLPLASSAQTAQLSTPTLAFLFDAESKSIRPVAGVPGAASLDGALAVSLKLARASISPNRLYAIAENSESDHLLLVRFNGKTASTAALDGSNATADLIAFSPSGSSAAMFSADAQQVQIWQGLPNQPSLSAAITAANLSAIALSNDGTLAGVSDSGLVLLGTGAPKQLSATQFVSLAFLPDTHDLAVADAGANQVGIIRAVDGDAQFVALAGAQDGVAQPNAVTFARDGQTLLVANAGNKSVLVVDLSTRSTNSVPCDCTLDGLFRAQGNSVFRLTNMGQDKLAFFDGDGDTPRIFSIPMAGGVQ